MLRHPPFLTSAAPEYIEFAERFHHHPYPWQSYALYPMLGVDQYNRFVAPLAGLWVPRQNGKGGLLEVLELYWLFVERHDLIVHSAHEARTAEQAYDRMEMIIRRNPRYTSLVRSFRRANGQQRIELRTGETLLYATRSGTAARGFTTPRLVVDEGQELTQEQVNAMFPTVSALGEAPGGYMIVVTGTPPRKGDAWAYGLRRDGEAGVPGMFWADWGAKTVEMTDPVQRRRVFTLAAAAAANPNYGVTITRATVEREMRPSGLGEGFPSERLGMWPPEILPANVKPLPYEVWEDLATDDPERTTLTAFGVEVAHDRSRTAIVALGRRSDGKLQWSMVAHDPGTDWVAGRMAELRATYRCWFAVQDKGPTGALFTAFEDAGLELAPRSEDEPEPGTIVVPWSAEVAAGFGLMIDACRERTVVHADDPPLNLAVANAETRAVGQGTGWDHRAPGGELLRAASNALWAYRTYADRPDADYDPLDSIG